MRINIQGGGEAAAKNGVWLEKLDNKTGEYKNFTKLDLFRVDESKTSMFMTTFSTKGMGVGKHFYRAAVNMPGGKNYTLPEEIRIDHPNVEDRMDKADALIDEINKKYFSDKSLKADRAKYIEYKRKAVEEIRKMPGVERIELYDDGVIDIDVDGMGYILEFEEHIRYHKELEKESLYQSEEPEIMNAGYNKNSGVFTAFPSYAEEYRGDDKNTIWSYKTIGIIPFKMQLSFYDEGKDGYEVIKKSKLPEFSPVGPITSRKVTVEHFKNLFHYGIIYIVSHGELRNKEFRLYTQEEITPKKQQIYYNDLRHKLLKKWTDMGDNKEYFTVTTDFIKKYNKRPDNRKHFYNSLVYIGACQGLNKPELAKTFLDIGAGAVIAYKNIVKIKYQAATGEDFFRYMIDGYTVDESFQKTIKENGPDDGQTPVAAYMAYMGNKSLRLVEVGIRDGGFEDKSMTYWGKNPDHIHVNDKTISNDPRNPSEFPNGGGPTEGKYMLQIKEFDDENKTEVYQTFIVPEKSKTLSLDRTVETIQYHKNKVCAPGDMYHYLCGKEPDIDYYLIVEDRDGKEITLKKEKTDYTSMFFQFYYIRPIPTEDPLIWIEENFASIYADTWKKEKYDISKFAGQKITLKIRLGKEKNISRMANIYIDNITID